MIRLKNYTVTDTASSIVNNKINIICYLCCSDKIRPLKFHHQGGIYKGIQGQEFVSKMYVGGVKTKMLTKITNCV